jgi:hypothetical protein
LLFVAGVERVPGLGVLGQAFAYTVLGIVLVCVLAWNEFCREQTEAAEKTVEDAKKASD